MFKSDMTDKELVDRGIFVEKIKESNWDFGGWETLFESGANLTPEAQAEFSNTFLTMRLGYYVGRNYVLLEFLRTIGDTLPNVRFYLKNDIGPVVDRVIAAQDVLSQHVFADFVHTMMPLCDKILIEYATGLVQVSPPDKS
jgi:hypothetical protein